MPRFITLFLLCGLCMASLIRAQDDSCSPLVPRLIAGEKARVISQFGNNLRTEPAKNGVLLVPLANGVEIEVLDGS